MAGIGSSCGACKFLRRKCVEGCVFAPYFSYDHGAIHFAAVHKVFGASNVSKMLSHMPVHHRGEAAATISYEAQARMRDPVYGCVAHIFALQQQVASLQEEIESLTTQLAATIANEDDGSSPDQAMYSNHFNSFDQLCMQQDSANLHVSSNPHASIDVNSYESFNGETNLQGLPPMYREAIERLEYSLFSDLANEPSTWEDLLPFV